MMIDLDDPAATETLSRYQVDTTPTTIVADFHGKVLQQARGGMAKEEFLELLARRRTQWHSAAQPSPAAGGFG
jgi:thiol:disulfide interchange protein